MASSTTTIRLTDEEKAAFTEMAEFEGVKLSTLVKDKLWEAYEDWRDVRLVKDYVRERRRMGDRYETVPHEEMMKEFAYGGK